MRKVILLSLIVSIFYIDILTASRFDELDKAPEGAHKGQMLVGGYFALGKPYGDIIDAEHDFLSGNTYTFEENEITKQLLVDHLYFSIGAQFEYMPVDHLGAKARLKRSVIIQRTIFGSQYENWSGVTYDEFSLVIGPSAHLTTRKRWDITLTPFIGYALASYTATPIATELVDNYEGDTKRTANGLVFGTELNFTAYFSGGLYISIGFDWTFNQMKLDHPYSLEQPNGNRFYNGKSESDIHNFSLLISAGYAFSN